MYIDLVYIWKQTPLKIKSDYPKLTVLGVCNTIVLIGKQFIYRCKCGETTPSFKQMVEEVKLNYRIETFCAVKNNRIEQVYNKWSNVFRSFQLELY